MVGLNSNILPIGEHEAEVTLIGGSSGFGECIVIRYEEDEWAIVDSCIDAKTQTCLPLEYLRALGVKPEEKVKYVICTHWHDDHIRGLHEVLNACSSDTIFCVAMASERLKFLYEIERSNLYEADRGVRKELILCMDKANEKGIKVMRLVQDQRVFKTDCCECNALSPSQKELSHFFEELAHAIDDKAKVAEQKEKLAGVKESAIESADNISNDIFNSFSSELMDGLIDSPSLSDDDYNDLKLLQGNALVTKPNINDRSVALLLTIQGHHIVLGADLEVSSDIECGWQSVNDSICMRGVYAGLFKIPHHGSSTGYYELFLRNHIKPEATGKLTTWIKGKKVRPEKDTLALYHQYFSKLYITIDPSCLTGKFTTPEYKKIMEESTESIVDIKSQYGIVQSRLDLTTGSDEWKTTTYGSARVVSQEMIGRM